MTQVLTLQLTRSVDLTVVAATLSWALLVDALCWNFLVDKPSHHDKMSFIKRERCVIYVAVYEIKIWLLWQVFIHIITRSKNNVNIFWGLHEKLLSRKIPRNFEVFALCTKVPLILNWGRCWGISYFVLEMKHQIFRSRCVKR